MSKFISVKEIQKSSFDTLKGEFGYTNAMAAPRLTKITLSVATGSSMKRDKRFNDLVMDRVMKITGQKATVRKAKKSVASFKTREGDPIGVAVTLRGDRMFSFLDKVLNVSLPRTKDFRGIKRTSVDDIGNMTFGIKEHTIFPEVPQLDVVKTHGMQVTFKFQSQGADHSKAYLDSL